MTLTDEWRPGADPADSAAEVVARSRCRASSAPSKASQRGAVSSLLDCTRKETDDDDLPGWSDRRTWPAAAPPLGRARARGHGHDPQGVQAATDSRP